jgi:DNA-directed RNA polymerase subunit D
LKISLREQDERSLKFILEDTSPSMANALRRTLITDIPKLAIEEVEFHLGSIRSEDGKEYQSVTPLFDEIISHRLGLIPLPTDPDLFVRREECEDCGGEGCPNCTVLYSLNKRGPGWVYSADLEPVGDTKMKPVDEKIPIVKLRKDQGMLVYATAILGTGKEHAKWQVVNGVGYKYYPVINIKHDDGTCDLCPATVASCPMNVFKIKKDKLVAEDVESCTLCMACMDESGGECVEVTGDPNRIIMRLETDGSMSAKKALEIALEILEEEFQDFAAKASKVK